MKTTSDFANTITSAGITVQPDFGRGITEAEKDSLSGSGSLSLVQFRQDVNENVSRTTYGDISEGVLFFSTFGRSRSAVISRIRGISALGFNDTRLTYSKTYPFTLGTGADAIIFYQWGILAAYDEIVDDLGGGIYRGQQAVEIRYQDQT